MEFLPAPGEEDIAQRRFVECDIMAAYTQNWPPYFIIIFLPPKSAEQDGTWNRSSLVQKTELGYGDIVILGPGFNLYTRWAPRIVIKGMK